MLEPHGLDTSANVRCRLITSDDDTDDGGRYFPPLFRDDLRAAEATMKIITDQATSARMRTIRGRGNRTTELVFAKALRAQRVTGWRRQLDITGKPDFAWPRLKVALFLDGCFWHGCPTCARHPKRNQAYWEEKMLKNAARDRQVTRSLRASGWTVVRIWEHELREQTAVMARLKRSLSEAKNRHTARAMQPPAPLPSKLGRSIPAPRRRQGSD